MARYAATPKSSIATVIISRLNVIEMPTSFDPEARLVTDPSRFVTGCRTKLTATGSVSTERTGLLCVGLFRLGLQV